MENWEIATNKFLEEWKNKKEVIGIIICGSYITGNPSKHSDVDIQILLDNKTNYRERGNKIINGILIEYFANPINKHYEYKELDFKKRTKLSAHMFTTGKVILDKTGEVKKLIKDMKKELTKKYPKQNKVQIELTKYSLWDMKDNLEEVYENNLEDFYLVYYNQLNKIFEEYTKYLAFNYYPAHFQTRFLTKKKDQQKYLLQEFPDKKFKNNYLNAIKLKDKKQMLKQYQNLTNYVLKKMGGFEIDGWKIKSPLN